MATVAGSCGLGYVDGAACLRGRRRGVWADRRILGRKPIYLYEVLVLALGAIASAFSPNIWWLIVFRIILGLGIGGDYTVSSTIVSDEFERT